MVFIVGALLYGTFYIVSIDFKNDSLIFAKSPITTFNPEFSVYSSLLVIPNPNMSLNTRTCGSFRKKSSCMFHIHFTIFTFLFLGGVSFLDKFSFYIFYSGSLFG